MKAHRLPVSTTSLILAAAVFSCCLRASVAADDGWFAFQPPKGLPPFRLGAQQLVEAPAGKHGFVQSKDGRLVFDDGTAARFWGVHFIMHDIPDLARAKTRQEQHAAIDAWVAWLKSMGINLIRRMPFYEIGGANFEYNQETWDTYDYIFYKCGQAGIYYKLCVDYAWPLRPEETHFYPDLPEAIRKTGIFKNSAQETAHYVCEPFVRHKWRHFKEVFTHLNPYNHNRYCDDPALALITIQNESSLFFYTTNFGQSPMKELATPVYQAWLKEKYGSVEGLRKAWTVGGESALKPGEGLAPDQPLELFSPGSFTDSSPIARKPAQVRRGQDQLRWMVERERQYWTRTETYLRGLGVKVPVAGSNWIAAGFTERMMFAANAQNSLFDRHHYEGRTEAAQKLPDDVKSQGNRHMFATSWFVNRSFLKLRDDEAFDRYNNMFVRLAWARVLDRPMMISEWNGASNIEYSLEVLPQMAALGLMQGWDAPIHFHLGSDRWADHIAATRNSRGLLVYLPWMLQYPVITRIWLRGDVKEAPLVAEKVYGGDDLYTFGDDRYPVPPLAAWAGKVGIRFPEKPEKPQVADLSKNIDAKAKTVRSVTGELTWNGNAGYLVIDSPRTQAVAGYLKQKDPFILKDVAMELGTEFGAIYVTTLDDTRPVRESRHLLICAVGRMKNTGMERYATGKVDPKTGIEFTGFKRLGGPPALLEAIAGTVTIKNDHAAKLHCWSLDVSGARRSMVAVQARGDTVTVPLSANHQAVYYELESP